MYRTVSAFIIILILSITTSYTQEDPYVPVAEEMPAPIGGYETIYKKIVYPELARKNGIEGKVYLLVYVSETGQVDDVKVVKGIGAGCDQAAEDIIRKTKFSPGKVQGKPTKVKLTIPFAFKLNK